MNSEIEIFKTEIIKHVPLLVNMGYSQFDEMIFNSNDLEHIFYEIRFLNQERNKYVTFNFYPSTEKYNPNQIEVYITYNDRSFGLSQYLSFKYFNKRLKHEDIIPFRFMIDNPNMVSSIRMKITEIFKLLTGELSKFLKSDDWITIPIHSQREDY